MSGLPSYCLTLSSAALLLLSGCASEVEPESSDPLAQQGDDPLCGEEDEASDDDASTDDDDDSSSSDDSGSDDSGSDDNADDDDGASGPMPVIPPPSMPCPNLTTGSQNIMGLNVELWVGEQSSGKQGPLLFYWHGTGSSSAEASFMLPSRVMDEILGEGGVIVAADNTTAVGADSTVILGVWYDGDFAFTDLVAACAVEQLDIDPRRIYSTGCSAGGLHSGVMAFARSSYLAAAVPNSGGIVLPVPLQDPANVPAIMNMHGAMGTDWVIVDFAEQSAFLADEATRAGGFVVNCDHGGGHCGAPEDLKIASWQFMKDHPFGAAPYSSLPSSFPSYCQVVQ